MSQQQQSLPGVTVEPNPWLTGKVVRVTWYSEDTGSIILKVLVDGRVESWLGKCAALKEGAEIRGKGPIEEHPKFGPQRQCGSNLVPSLPVTSKGLLEWLSMGNLDGVGPVTASAIVAMFGERTKDIFDNNPQALLRVPGIGPKKLEKIQAAWADAAAEFELMAFFSERGISTNIANRIVKTYGSGRATSIVSSQPYRLALEVQGIGFKTADDIARSVGIGEDSPERAEAGVYHVIHDRTQRGDCYVTVRSLMRSVRELLGEFHADVMEALNALANTPRPAGKGQPPSPLVVVVEHNGEQCCYTRALYRAEVDFAARMRELLTYPVEPLAGAEEAIAQFEQQSGAKLAPEQRLAVETAARCPVMIMTGGPGTGKSFSTRAIANVFDSAKLTTVLASPTGRAAKKLSEATGKPASTIHRMLGIRIDDLGRPLGFAHDSSNTLPARAVMLDEVSMLPIDLANHLVQAIKPGTRLVMIGDVDQLPSVGPGAVLRDMITSGTIPTVRLKQVFRQAEGSAIIDAAYQVNNGKSPRGPGLMQADPPRTEFVMIHEADPEQAASLIVNLVTKIIPMRWGFVPGREIQTLLPMNRGRCGVIALNEAIQARVNTRGVSITKSGHTYRVGDPTLHTRNDAQRDVYNGDRGVVTAIDVEEGSMTVNYDGREVTYEGPQFQQVMLAYASSIHRSQGSTIPCVVTSLLGEHRMMYSRNLLYTAITRAAKLCVMVVDPRSVAMAVRETKREDRRTLLTSRLRG